MTASGIRFRLILLSGLAFFALLSIQGCSNSAQQKLNFQTEYQAVFLDNGQVFFGKIVDSNSEHIKINDVFYVRSLVDKDKDNEAVKNILVKRGQEWHGPDMMYVNTRHIVFIEPVSASSKVGELIKEAKK